MKELTAATGVPKGTIQFYIKEGLIPKPVKTKQNMAYYTEAHVNAVRLVKELQTKRFFPLAVIKKIMANRKSGLNVSEVRVIAEMDGKLFRNLEESLTVKKITADQLSARTGAKAGELKDLEQKAILHPVKKGTRKYYDEDDIHFMECWRKMRELGFSEELGFNADVLKPHRELMEQLVEEETRIMLSRTLGKIELDELVRMVEEGTGVLNTMIGLIHKRLILETVRTLAEQYRNMGEQDGKEEKNRLTAEG